MRRLLFFMIWFLFLFRGVVVATTRQVLARVGLIYPPLPQPYWDWLPLVFLASLVVMLLAKPSL